MVADQNPASHVERSDSADERTRLADERTRLAYERTQLADDRTLLAWCRTSFGAYVLAVGLGGASLVDKGASAAYGVLGVIFALVGTAAAVLGIWQYRAAPPSDPDRFPALRIRLSTAFGVVIALMGVGIAILILITR
jgi:uncharacterized membrane protein YidH (DUF202 family)